MPGELLHIDNVDVMLGSVCSCNGVDRFVLSVAMAALGSARCDES